MARIRSIKPEFFTSEQIVECSTSARLLFVGMWCFSDDQGVHPASVKRLKMEVFPSDPFTDSDIQKMVNELLTTRLITEFSSENQRFWAITGWKRHQKIDRPTNKYPVPPEMKFDEHSTNAPRGLDDDSSTARPRIGEEGIGEEVNTNTPVTPLAGGDGDSSKSKPSKRSKQPPFVKPTVEEVRAYCLERKNGIDAEEFVDRNESVGWVVGKSCKPMTDWRATIRTWEKNQQRANSQDSGPAVNGSQPPKPRCLTSEELARVTVADIQGRPA